MHVRLGGLLLLLACGGELGTKAPVDTSIELPRTLHYRGHGRFMVAGDEIDRSRDFRVQNL